MSIRKVLAEVLEGITVPEAEVKAIESLAKDFIRSLKRQGLSAFVGGSLAKGTMIKKNVEDVDIFVVFDYSEDISKLEAVLKKMKLPGKLKQVHGSRDYFQVECSEAVLEIIPVVRNEDPELAENVTDVSLSHVKYVSGELKNNPDLADEIKLAKAFCKANRVYGAESYVRGFSGYSLEVLVIYFGGFAKFLKGVGKKSVIDPMKYYRNEAEIRRELNSSKIQGPLVVVDPTFKWRNVVAGLGSETFEKFKEIAKSFLKNPTEDYFERKGIDVGELESYAQKKKARLLKLGMKTDRQEGDIAGTKCRKIFDFFISELGRKGQRVLRSEFDYSFGQEAVGYIVVEEVSEIEIKGPRSNMGAAVEKFRKARKKVYERRGSYWTKEKVSVEKILKQVKTVEKEMGAEIKEV